MQRGLKSKVLLDIIKLINEKVWLVNNKASTPLFAKNKHEGKERDRPVTEKQLEPCRAKPSVQVNLFDAWYSHTIMYVSFSQMLNSKGTLKKLIVRLLKYTWIVCLTSRFSRDTETIDNTLPATSRGFLAQCMGVVSTIFVVLYSTPIIVTVLIPVMVVYYIAQVSNQCI